MCPALPSGRRVDFVGELLLGLREVDRCIEALEQLLQCFAWAPLEHGQAVVIVVGHRGAFDRWQRTDADLPAIVLEQKILQPLDNAFGARLLPMS